MPVDNAKPVIDPHQIIENIKKFNSDANKYKTIAYKILKSSKATYWLYDSKSETFGPNKFCGFVGMTFPEYERRKGDRKPNENRPYEHHGGITGGAALKNITKVLNKTYKKDSKLHSLLRAWAKKLIGLELLGTPQQVEQWQFITIGEVADPPQETETEQSPSVRDSSPTIAASTPCALDITEPPTRVVSTTYRILRDTHLARIVKALHKNECQLCKHTIQLPDGSRYSEAHHIQPLGKPHNGLDTISNIICVCPNCHTELDYGVRSLEYSDLFTIPQHTIDEKFILYHNKMILKKRNNS